MHKYEHSIDHHILNISCLISDEGLAFREVLIAQGDEEALKVIAAAAEEGIAGKFPYYSFSFWSLECLSIVTFSSMRVHSPHLLCLYHITVSFLISGHDLAQLTQFDLQKIPDIQTLGSDMVHKVQHIMESQFSHSDCGPTLSEDQIQSIIIGVINFHFPHPIFLG